MKRTTLGLLSSVFVAIAAGCCLCELCPLAGTVELSYDFGDGAHGWQAGFADYPVGTDAFHELDSGIRPLPAELNTAKTGFLLSGNNHADDLFMFFAKKLGPEDGIVAGRTYCVRFVIRFASNAPTGCFGVGGAPGENVYLKAGATPDEPTRSEDGNGWWRMDVDKGNQSEGGDAASSAGNVANGLDCNTVPEPRPYVSLTRRHTHTTTVTADDDGVLWLLIGTDSGFEATTALYYERVDVRLIPVAG